MWVQSGVRSPRRRHPSAHRPRERGAGARSAGQASAQSRPEPRAETSVSELEHGEDGEDATLTVASTTARSPGRWAQDPAGRRGRTQQVGGHPITSPRMWSAVPSGCRNGGGVAAVRGGRRPGESVPGGVPRLPHIKQHYYRSHLNLNPKGFVPSGPDLTWLTEPHGRTYLAGGPPEPIAKAA
jgi:hypothetical protein